ncbi:MAG: antibiotic biosynthesis monooxygenase family protein [Pikeienuella sp.]
MPRTTPEQPMQTVITTFEVTPGTCDDLVDLLRGVLKTHISRQPGFVSAALHVNDARTRVANYSRWRSRADFLAMLRGAGMREHNRRLHELSRSFEPVMYEVEDAFEA